MVTDRPGKEDGDREPINEQTVSITEFRGSGRARYLTRQRDPAAPSQVLAGTTTWYDYDGDRIYGDYEVGVDGQTVTATQVGITETGFGQVDYNDSGVSYFHGDQIGSTRLLTDSPHTLEDSYVYTAFGEKVYADGTIGTRYRYAGAWGYQNNSEFAAPNSAFDAMHVGHRYYSPSTGRFLQRDPIGLRGGLNVYAYVLNLPTRGVDRLGYRFWDGNNWFHDWIARKIWQNPKVMYVTKVCAVGGVGAGLGAAYGAGKGAIVGAGAGAVAGGVGAAPGAVAGALAGGLIGAIEGFAAGVAGAVIGGLLF